MKKSKYLIYALYLGQFILNASNSVIAPFFPQMAERYGISQIVIGIIFSIQPVGNFIFSLVLGKQLSQSSKRKKYTILGIVLTWVGLSAFILIKYIINEYIFITITLIARFILGIVFFNNYIIKFKYNLIQKGAAFFSTPAYSYLPIFYRDTFEEKCGWMETMCGLGLMIGPLLGALLVYFGENIYLYIYIFIYLYIYIFIYLQIPILIQLIPSQNDLNYQQETLIKDQESSKEQTIELDEEITEEINISYIDLFQNRYIIFNYILIFLPSCGLLFLDPTMGIYFNKVYGLDDLWVGLLFSIGTSTYLFLSPLGTYMIKFLNNYSLLLFIGTFITGLSFIFLGPDPLLGLPQKLYITCIANVFIGIATLFIYIPALPQLYKILLRIYGKKLQNQQIIGDISSALYNTSYAIGEFIGPLLGGALSQYLSFQRGASVFGIVIIAFSLVYLLFGGVFKQSDQIDNEFNIQIKQNNQIPIIFSPGSKCDSQTIVSQQQQLIRSNFQYVLLHKEQKNHCFIRLLFKVQNKNITLLLKIIKKKKNFLMFKNKNMILMLNLINLTIIQINNLIYNEVLLIEQNRYLYYQYNYKINNNKIINVFIFKIIIQFIYTQFYYIYKQLFFILVFIYIIFQLCLIQYCQKQINQLINQSNLKIMI
ncbi:major facilitator superfamily protein, putative [Ichthyophthirius multifiliis]|uniref:Major facilitator superfamily protein, putative n=1 Tax=Ichthyophthirius multifiliis TaxID=5932 RepID=G0R3Y3_ICHMU|nr:major facilitator superfamily protein, putative [Ichthyophthirius multifiliis]EGR27814.1 major facilitator superfamily protein, putative [Ichthyophthirius multifiliis]|eukprot:XP_004027159.1 major facilitator superfamily protein, putative [Ichthyophthirius multifiliis]